MGTYTLRLSEIVDILGLESAINDEGVRTLSDWRPIGLATYPISQHRDRNELNGLILDTYWNREIAHETIEIFEQRMRTTMHTVMRNLYNPLYDTVALEFDPLTTMDMRTTSTSTSDTESSREGTVNSTTTQNAQSRSTSSDLPQMQLAMDGDYADSGVDGLSASEGVTTGGDSATSTDAARAEAESRTVGYAGSPASLVQEYRAAIINVDQMVIDDLDRLFLQLWGTPHSFVPNPYGA